MWLSFYFQSLQLSVLLSYIKSILAKCHFLLGFKNKDRVLSSPDCPGTLHRSGWPRTHFLNSWGLIVYILKKPSDGHGAVRCGNCLQMMEKKTLET